MQSASTDDLRGQVGKNEEEMKSTHFLTNQHKDLRKMFRHLKKGNGHTRKLLETLATSLLAHMVVEQELFYPAALKELTGKHREELVFESYEEHAMARYALDRLMKADPTDRTFGAKLATFTELTLDHFRKEEAHLFPKAEKQLGGKSKALTGHLHTLFESMKKSGYAAVSAKGGAAIASAQAPESAQRRATHAD